MATTTMKKYDVAGKQFADHTPGTDLFTSVINVGVMHQAVVRQLANARAGTASTLTRSEVSGGGKKPWKQKGTGRARAGSIRSPLWKGGGISFGPKPRSYAKAMPKGQRDLAFRSALAAQREQMILLTGVEQFEAKTKRFAELLSSMELAGKKVMMLTAGEMDHLVLAARNLPNVELVNAQYVGPYDLLRCERILMTEAGLATLERRATRA